MASRPSTSASSWPRASPSTNDVTLSPARFSQSVVVTARRVEELAQDVPIPVSVVRGDLVSDAGAFNVNRLKEMIPTVQFYTPTRATRRSTSAASARRSA